MATKPDNQNLTRSKSLGRKTKPVGTSEPEANGRKTIEKPLPNYLKPTISSRPDPVKFLKKNNAENNQKLLRRRSLDRPPSSSLTSPSTSSSHKPRDRPVVSKEKPVTGLRSTSSNGSSRGGVRGSSTVKSPPAVSRGPPGVKKSGLSGSSSSKSTKVGSENVRKTHSSKEITPESSPLAPSHEETVKVETDVQGSDQKEEDNDQVARSNGSGEEKEISPVDVSTEEEKGELINEDKTELKNTEELNSEDKEVADVPNEENRETIASITAVNVDKSKEEEEVEEVKEEESESSKVKEEVTETKAQVEELPEIVVTKSEVVKGKKGSPTAYNDVIASKIQGSSKKNSVLALAGAFQTVIDYETAASK